ncbi:MAG: hypothetical protein GC181_14320 [Bacteroidetes bacterium]|nr:hypothetical protein [Bacteroidota bacterium]
MIYYIIKVFIQLYYRIYFRKIYLHDAGLIPTNKPTFIASNHPNGFLDGTILTAILLKPTYIFVRGDVFKKSWANFILRDLHLIPIFRVRDADDMRQSVTENNRSYDQLFDLFCKKKRVLIFSESDSVPAMKLRPLKKGTARMVADMERRGEGNLQVTVVPMGINYSFYRGFGKEVFMNYAKPVFLKNYQEEGKSESFTINKFTADLHKRMSSLIIHFEDEVQHLQDFALEVVRNQHRFGFRIFDRNKELFKHHHRMAAMLCKEDSGLANKLNVYKEELKKFELNDRPKQPGFITLLISVLLIIPAFISWLPLQWAFNYGSKVANQKVKKFELHDSVVFGVGVAVNMILDIVAIIIFTVCFGFKGFLLYSLFRWISVGYASSKEHLRRWKVNMQWRKFSKSNPADFSKLELMQSEIIAV